ncbi:MAG: DUF6273 domain-containing protein, partial [Micrococcales bacterium]|nr:DUF6273 domain-containing protein [Micrococcales bacterium]
PDAQVVHDAGVDDRVDDARAVRGMQDRQVGREEVFGLSTAHDVKSTAAEVDKVCQEIAGGGLGSAPVWLSGYAWRVLDVVGTRALLLADRMVGTRPYHYVQVAVTWRDCSLRRWLNDEFCVSLGEALVSRVVTAKVRNEPNPVWGTRGGKDTKDQIFLLSMREAAVHFTGKEPDVWDDYRYMFLGLGEKGAAKHKDGKRDWWWLRSPGRAPGLAALVRNDGYLNARGRGYVAWASGGVRPAFWLDLQS